MGCDIHFYVERRIDGAWVTADTWVNEYGDGLNVPFSRSFYNERNYGLFAILANVRNSCGIIPISEPRGVPDDACPEYLALEKDHSASWLSLAELLAYDWTQEAVYSGTVDPVGWARVRDHPESGPREWSASVGGGSVRHYTPEQFEAAWVKLRMEREYPESRYASAHLRPITGGNADLDRFAEILGNGEFVSPYTKVSWVVPYYRLGATFFGETVPRLLRLGAPEDVRCCFFFDN